MRGPGMVSDLCKISQEAGPRIPIQDGCREAHAGSQRCSEASVWDTSRAGPGEGEGSWVANSCVFTVIKSLDENICTMRAALGPMDGPGAGLMIKTLAAACLGSGPRTSQYSIYPSNIFII